MKKNFFCSIWLILISLNICSQHYNKLRLYNLYDNSLLDSIEVMTMFEDCDISPLMMDFDAKEKFYYYKKKIRTLKLKIASPYFFYPGLGIYDVSFDMRTDTCKKGICHLGLLPTTMVSFHEPDTSFSSFVNVAFILKAKCKETNRKMFHDDKWVYQSENCATINDSLCEYNFEITKDKHVFYFTPDNTLEMKFSFRKQQVIKNIALSVDIKEVKIYVDQKLSTVVFEEIKR